MAEEKDEVRPASEIEEEVKEESKDEATDSSPRKKSEEEILMPEIDIGEYTIKPWTLGKLKKINPHLEQVFQKLEKKNINLTSDNVQDHLTDLYFAAVEPLVSILAITLDKKEEDLEELTISDTIKLVYLIYKQNEESVKNVSSLLQMTETGTL